MKTIGSYEAKTKLPMLLAWVEEHQESLIITRRGKEVAKIVPIHEKQSAHQVVESIKQLRKGNILGNDIPLKSYISEGRK